MRAQQKDDQLRIGVLLLHGLAGTPAELRYLAQVLEREGFEVRTPVVPGLACGTDLSRLSTWSDWYATVQREFDDLAQSCDLVYVGGLSAGAVLALKLAADRPADVHGLLLMSTTLSINGWAIPWSFKLFNLVHTRWIARRFQFAERDPYGIKDPSIRSFVLRALQNEFKGQQVEVFSVNGLTVLELRRLSRRVRKELWRISLPALVIHPREDDQSDLDNALVLQRNLAGPVDSIVLDNSYHVVTLDKQRQVVAESTIRFIRRTSEAQALAKLQAASASDQEIGQMLENGASGSIA